MGKGDRKASRPSSSARSMQLLQGGGGSVGFGQGFGGYMGSQPLAGAVSDVASHSPGGGESSGGSFQDHMMSGGGDMDNEMVQQMKRLYKKDANTKTKALQALRALLQERPAAEAAAAAPVWAVAFKQLALDGQRSVRLESCGVMAELAAALGRKLAPHLRQLAPPWLLLQFDGFPDVAAAARRGFEAAFPTQEKQDGVLVYASTDILAFTSACLTMRADTLGDPRKETAEELQARHERGMAQSLLLLARMVTQLHGSHGEAAAAAASAVQESVEGMIAGSSGGSQHTLKSAMSSASPGVRGGAFRLVEAAAVHMPAALEPHVAAVAPLVLGSLGEKDAAVHAAMWEMLFAYLRTFPSAWHACNLRKMVLPRLQALLRHCCYGSALRSRGAMLPLLLLLPEAVRGPEAAAVAAILDSMWLGCRNARSPAERQAMAEALSECYATALARAGTWSRIGNSTPHAQYLTDLLNRGPLLAPGTSILNTALQALPSGTAPPSPGLVQCAHRLLCTVLSSAAVALNTASDSGPMAPGPGSGTASLDAQVVNTEAAGTSAAVLLAALQPAVLPPGPGGASLEAAVKLLSELATQLPHEWRRKLVEGCVVPLVHACAPWAIAGPEAGPGTGACGAYTAFVAKLVQHFGSEMQTSLLQQLQHQRTADAAPPEAAGASPGAGSGTPLDLDAVVQGLLAAPDGSQLQEAAADLVLSCLVHRSDPGAALAGVLEELVETAAVPDGQGSAHEEADMEDLVLRCNHAAAAKSLLIRLGQEGTGKQDEPGMQALVGAEAVEQLALRLADGLTLRSAASSACALKAQLLAALMCASVRQPGTVPQPLLGGACLQQLLTSIRTVLEQEPEPGDGCAPQAAVLAVLESILHAMHRKCIAAAPGAGLERGLAGVLRALMRLAWQAQDEGAAPALSHALAAAQKLQLAQLQRLFAVSEGSDSDSDAASSADEDGKQPATASTWGILDGSGESYTEAACRSAAAAVWTRMCLGSLSCSLWQLPLVDAEVAEEAAEQLAAAAAGQLTCSSAWAWVMRLVMVQQAVASQPQGCSGSMLLERVLEALLPEEEQQPSACRSAGPSGPGPGSRAALILALLAVADHGCAVLRTGSPVTAKAAAAVLDHCASVAESGSGDDLQAVVSEGAVHLALVERVQDDRSLVQDVLEGLWQHSESSSSAVYALQRLLLALSAAASAVRSSDAVLENLHDVMQHFSSHCIAAAVAPPSSSRRQAVLEQVLPPLMWHLRRHTRSQSASGAALDDISLPCLQQAITLPPLSHALAPDGGTGSDAADALALVAACFPVEDPGRAAAVVEGQWSCMVLRESLHMCTAVLEDTVPDRAAAELAASEAERQLLWGLTTRQLQGSRSAAAASAATARAGGPSAGEELGDEDEGGAGSDALLVDALVLASTAYACLPPGVDACMVVLDHARDRATHASSCLEVVLVDTCLAAADGLKAAAPSVQQSSPALLLPLLTRLRDLAALREEHLEDLLEHLSHHEDLDAALQVLEGLVPTACRAADHLQHLQMEAAPEGMDLEGAEAALTAVLGELLRCLLCLAAVEALASACSPGARNAWHTQLCSHAGRTAVWSWMAPAMRLVAGDPHQMAAALQQFNDWAADETGVDAPSSLLSVLRYCHSGTGRGEKVPLAAISDAAVLLLFQSSFLPQLLASRLTGGLEHSVGDEGVGTRGSTGQLGEEDAVEAGEEEVDVADLEEQHGDRPGKFLAEVGLHPLLAQHLVPPEAAGQLAPPQPPTRLEQEEEDVRLMLAWALVLTLLSAARPASPLRYRLSEALRSKQVLTQHLLDRMVSWLPLPHNPGKVQPAGQLPGTSDGSGRGVIRIRQLLLGGQGLPKVGELQRQRVLAAAVYHAVLQVLPASAREWYRTLRGRAGAAVEAYTAATVSPSLLKVEMHKVLTTAGGGGGSRSLSIKASSVAREVVAVMEVDDGAFLELLVRLPICMPLLPPEVDCRRKAGVAESQLRKWLLSINVFLRNQNCSVAEAVQLWKRNVDKQFEGLEPCLICYSIIHASSRSLPRLSCKTCNLRFHSACLYKWFKSSGKSNCPHCQAPW